MSSTSRRYRGRRRGGSRRSASLRGQANKPTPLCEVCNEPIKDISTAIAKPDSSLPIHFECALDIVSKELNPRDDEKIIYLGKGSFAAVKLEAYRRKRLIVRSQVDWENTENRGDWRIGLKTSIL